MGLTLLWKFTFSKDEFVKSLKVGRFLGLGIGLKLLSNFTFSEDISFGVLTDSKIEFK
tara:strand:- start:18 stop:191 length:174 start_codon:yes stop_codon:yes gene_type:complete